MVQVPKNMEISSITLLRAAEHLLPWLEGTAVLAPGEKEKRMDYCTELIGKSHQLHLYGYTILSQIPGNQIIAFPGARAQSSSLSQEVLLDTNSHLSSTHPGRTPSPSLTRAPHTNILVVLAVALPPGLRSTVPQGGLPAPAPHLVQPDAPVSRAKRRGPHGFQGRATAQLLTQHLGLCQAPGVITHGAPGATVPDLHPPWALAVSSPEPELLSVWKGSSPSCDSPGRRKEPLGALGRGRGWSTCAGGGSWTALVSPSCRIKDGKCWTRDSWGWSCPQTRLSVVLGSIQTSENRGFII